MIGLALSRAATAQPDPVDKILDAVREHLGMEIASAARYVDDRRQFTHIRTDLPLPQRPGDSEPSEETYCWHVARGNLPELIHDAADHPLAQTLPITSALPVGCHMDVPIRLKDGSLYGSFCCLSRTADRSLTGRDLAALRVFADLAAAQIEADYDQSRSRALVVDRVSAAVQGGQPSVFLQPVERLNGGAHDVGAGYAGLRHILDLAPDVLKLDMALVRDVDRDPARRALIEAMVRLAAHMDAQIVAEGIEREGERDVLAALGVDYGQGWLFGRAVPPVVASRMLLGETVDVAPPALTGQRAAA